MKAQELPAVAGKVTGRPDSVRVRRDTGARAARQDTGTGADTAMVAATARQKAAAGATTAGQGDASRATAGQSTDPARQDTGAGAGRQLWVEEPALRWRLPDPVRTSAVRAVIIISLTLIQAMVAYLCTLAGSWLAFPMTLSSVASTVAATWGVLDVWITRQVWNQRNGVVSVPSSTARQLRRERRRARRTARKDARIRDRGRSGAGQLSEA